MPFLSEPRWSLQAEFIIAAQDGEDKRQPGLLLSVNVSMFRCSEDGGIADRPGDVQSSQLSLQYQLAHRPGRAHLPGQTSSTHSSDLPGCP